jgi:bifunctional UDP-N-acetylglucosamine pyrophosphorylase/glucosamine-1-phosphate N-acetyltransferase
VQGRLLAHVLERAKALHAGRTIVIYGHGGDTVPAGFADPALKFVLQEPQLGTGHAVQQALPYLLSGGTTLILYGDEPLTRHDTLARLAATAAGLSLLTALLDDPTGYGRIVRDKDGAIARIVEEKTRARKKRRSARSVPACCVRRPPGSVNG